MLTVKHEVTKDDKRPAETEATSRCDWQCLDGSKIATGEAQETFVDDGKDQNQRHLHHCLLLARILRSEALRGLSMTEKVVPYML